MDSILQSVKLMLGIAPEYNVFDPTIIMHINSAFFTLHQLGVGPKEGYSIYDSTDDWSAYFGDSKNLESVKQYVYMKVRQAFDPPSSSAAIDALNRQIAELEWRINVAVDKPSEQGVNTNG